MTRVRVSWPPSVAGVKKAFALLVCVQGRALHAPIVPAQGAQTSRSPTAQAPIPQAEEILFYVHRR